MTDPVLFDYRVLTRPAILMERRLLLLVTFMEETSWLGCTLSLARSGDYGNLLEWIVYKSATILHALVSIPQGMPVANALLVHFLIHHGAKIAVYIPGRAAISINGAGETLVQAIADISPHSMRNICPKPSRKSSLSLPCPASKNVLIKRALFSGHDVRPAASQYRYMADIYLVRDWKTIRQFYHGRATNKNVQTIKHIHRNDIDGQDDTPYIQDVELEKERHQHSCTETQDMWEFYNYYPQVVSLLGIKQERDRRNTVMSSEYCLDDEDNRSCNDSGIDIPTSQIHVRAVQDTYNDDAPLRSSPGTRNVTHTTASVRGQCWSVDEMIALSLLEAMELRNNNARDDAGRARTNDRTRSNKSFRRAIAKFFRKFAISRG